LLQIFVKSLDKCFENVCEFDFIFHFEEVHHILAEVILGGMIQYIHYYSFLQN
ncbi:hypothetical protein C1645_696060, partial [Glomus cerebriforme]